MADKKPALDRVGEYVVKGVVGEGGMGIVYEGLQPVIGKRVAIKLLKKDFAQDPEEARRLLEEARAVNAVGHRGIIDIFSFGTLPDGRQYFVMEYLAGVPLSQHVRQNAPLLPQDVLQIVDEISAALAAAHNAGVIHRDLKPSNIFLVSSPDGSSYVKLLDFGLAKQAELARGDVPQTRVSRVLGTPEFMAPEQARAEPVGPRTDLYALGVVTYEMLTGQLPFDAPTPYEIVNMQLNVLPRPPSELEESVPPELDQLVLKLLEKEASQRPPTAEVVRQEIKRVRKALRLDATRLATPVVPLQPLKPKLPMAPQAAGEVDFTWTPSHRKSQPAQPSLADTDPYQTRAAPMTASNQLVTAKLRADELPSRATPSEPLDGPTRMVPRESEKAPPPPQSAPRPPRKSQPEAPRAGGFRERLAGAPAPKAKGLSLVKGVGLALLVVLVAAACVYFYTRRMAAPPEPAPTSAPP